MTPYTCKNRNGMNVQNYAPQMKFEEVINVTIKSGPTYKEVPEEFSVLTSFLHPIRLILNFDMLKVYFKNLFTKY